MNKTKFLERINDLIWYCLIVYAASDIFSIAIVQIFAGALIILFVIKKIFAGDLSFQKNPFNIPLLVFILTRVISVFLSVNFEVSLPSLYKEILFYFVFYVLVSEIDINNRQRLKLILQIIISTGLVATLYGISIYIFVHHERISSTASGYYTLGMYLTACLAIGMMTGKTEIFPKRYFWWIANLIFMAGILLTLDRVHWAAMTFAVLISGVLKERKFLLVYLIIFVISILAVPSLLERIMLVFQQMDFSERGMIWKGAYVLMWKHPVFGFGTETFTAIFPFFDYMYDKGVSSWHNDYIQLYMESGLVCLVSYIYLIVIIYKKSFQALKKFKGTEKAFHAEILPGLLLAFTTFIFCGFLLDPITRMLFILIIALVALIVSENKEGTVT